MGDHDQWYLISIAERLFLQLYQLYNISVKEYLMQLFLFVWAKMASVKFQMFLFLFVLDMLIATYLRYV